MPMENQYISPVLRILSNSIVPSVDAQLSRCANFEMLMADCLDAYGIHVGREKCQDYIADFKECLDCAKQAQRVKLIRQERMAQYKRGERKEPWSKTPDYDAY